MRAIELLAACGIEKAEIETGSFAFGTDGNAQTLARRNRCILHILVRGVDLCRADTSGGAFVNAARARRDA